MLRSLGLRGSIGVLLTLATATTASAYLTPVYPPPVGEDTITQIMQHYCGSSGVWTRHDDAWDQVWTEYDGLAVARARFAGHSHAINYVTGLGPGGTPAITWQTITGFSGNPYAATGQMTIQIGSGWYNPFRFLMKDLNTNNIWSSLEADNWDALDHMVSYHVTTDALPDVGGNSSGNWFVFWEDLALGDPGCDRDYNDLVLEVSQVAPIPEPTTILLVGVGLLGAAVVSWRRKRG